MQESGNRRLKCAESAGKRNGVLSSLQGSGPRMSQEEEGVRQVSGESRRRPGEPKQDTNRRTESPQRPLLS